MSILVFAQSFRVTEDAHTEKSELNTLLASISASSNPGGQPGGGEHLFQTAQLDIEQSSAAKYRHGIGDWLVVGSSPGLGCTVV